MHILRLFALILWVSVPVSAQEIHGLYIANQGNFSDGNGSITWYDFSTNSAETVLSDFGTIIQSVTLHENFGYIASNTSNNIDILDLTQNMRIGQIRKIGEPRYISVVNAEKAYVTENLGSGKIKVLNLSTRIVSDSIATGSKPQDIAVTGNRAFVANYGFGSGSTLTVIDTQTDMVIETINLGCDGPRHLEVDAQQNLWAFCTGNTRWNDAFTEIIEKTNGAAIVLNPNTGDVLNRIEFTHQIGSDGPGQDSYYSPESEEIFLIRSDGGSSVLVFDTVTNTLKETIPFSGDERVGGLVYDAISRLFYIGRFNRDFATAFTEPGFVQIANRDDLSEVGRFTVGIAPAHLVFYRSGRPTALEDIGMPDPESMLSAYPNPFNDFTTLIFEIEQSQHVSLIIYDALGREVSRLISGLRSAGQHRVVWEADHFPAGMYLSRLMIGDYITTGALIRTY